VAACPRQLLPASVLYRSQRMSELRQDPVSQRWVIIAQDRENRPNEFIDLPVARVPRPCPFCAGNECDTPDAVAVYSTDRSRAHAGH